jgi:hypothetical protein
LSPGLPCSHQRVAPATPCTSRGGCSVRAILQGGRAAPARLRPHRPCIRRLRRGGDGGPGPTPLHCHALADMGRRQGGGGADAALPSPQAVKLAARLCPGEAPGPRARHVSWVCAVRPHCSVCMSAALFWLVWCYACCRLPWAASLCLTPVVVSHRLVTVTAMVAGGSCSSK